MTDKAPFFIFSESGRQHLSRYEHVLSALAIASGFAWDLLTIEHPDSIFSNIIFLSYLIISGFGIVLINLKHRRGHVVPLYVMALVQFSFGNLAGGLLILYIKSGTFAGSALFFLLLACILIGNEFLRTRYSRVHFQIAVWYLLTLLYLAILVPVLMDEIGVRAFLMSGFTSLLLAFCFFSIISLLNPDALRGFKRIMLSIGIIFFVFNGLYFLNIIPPVPLGLTSIGIYHSVARADAGYTGIYEKAMWWNFFHTTSNVFTAKPGEPAYCFSSIYAPVGLSTPIAHEWKYYDESQGGYVTKARVLFPISGGRAEGYRGFSVTNQLLPGTWRCDVETAGGALIGRAEFKVVSGNPLLNEVKL